MDVELQILKHLPRDAQPIHNTLPNDSTRESQINA